MVLQTETTQEPLTDSELLTSIEGRAQCLWESTWEAGGFVLYAMAHKDLVPGTTEYTGSHRIIVSYTPSREFAYFYRSKVFEQPTPLENREEALIAISMFRRREVSA